jgi:biopolymer transport protein ExbB/TolQ
MASVLTAIARDAGGPDGEPSIAKRLADFDFAHQRKLARTRLLVRFGPALGLMGTLIPLAPALQGLADGDTSVLADNLRIAFSVTVLGILVGAAAFAISLLRDRIYDQDHSDLEYVAAILTAEEKQS